MWVTKRKSGKSELTLFFFPLNKVTDVNVQLETFDSRRFRIIEYERSIKQREYKEDGGTYEREREREGKKLLLQQPHLIFYSITLI